MGLDTLENKIITLHPNAPAKKDYSFHEKRAHQLLESELLKSLKRVGDVFKIKLNGSPAFLREGASNEVGAKLKKEVIIFRFSPYLRILYIHKATTLSFNLLPLQ